MNLGLAEPGSPAPEDGSHGHLYMYWVPPTTTKPGALLFGCEGSAPGCESYYGAAHTAAAARGEFSPTGGLKFSDAKFDGYEVRPKSVDGLRVDLTGDEVQKLMRKSVKEFDTATELRRPAGEKSGVTFDATAVDKENMGAEAKKAPAMREDPYAKHRRSQVTPESQAFTPPAPQQPIAARESEEHVTRKLK